MHLSKSSSHLSRSLAHIRGRPDGLIKLLFKYIYFGNIMFCVKLEQINFNIFENQDFPTFWATSVFCLHSCMGIVPGNFINFFISIKCTIFLNLKMFVLCFWYTFHVWSFTVVCECECSFEFRASSKDVLRISVRET